MSKKGKLFAALATLLVASFESFAFKSNAEKSEWTFTSEEMDALNEGFESLQNENKTLSDEKVTMAAEISQLQADLEKVKGEKTDASTKLTASEKSLKDIHSQLKLGDDANDEKVKSAISKLLSLPGATGAESSTTDDDDLGGGSGKDKPINSWEIKGDRKADIIKRSAKLH